MRHLLITFFVCLAACISQVYSQEGTIPPSSSFAAVDSLTLRSEFESLAQRTEIKAFEVYLRTVVKDLSLSKRVELRFWYVASEVACDIFEDFRQADAWMQLWENDLRIHLEEQLLAIIDSKLEKARFRSLAGDTEGAKRLRQEAIQECVRSKVFIEDEVRRLLCNELCDQATIDLVQQEEISNASKIFIEPRLFDTVRRTSKEKSEKVTVIALSVVDLNSKAIAWLQATANAEYLSKEDQSTLQVAAKILGKVPDMESSRFRKYTARGLLVPLPPGQ